ncbi:hypothetical protein QTP88_019338 [Uroleucon formosanum]
MADCSPYEFYKLFFDDDVLDFLIEETNRYASQLLINQIRNRFGSIIKKPKAVDYNMGKSYIDCSDQMASYSSPLKRSLKWYRKITFDILLSTSVVNALSLFKSVTKNNVKITFFKEEIIKSLLHKPEIPKTIPLKANHNLVTSENGKKECVRSVMGPYQQH